MDETIYLGCLKSKNLGLSTLSKPFLGDTKQATPKDGLFSMVLKSGLIVSQHQK